MSSQADINSVNYDAAVAARDAAMFAGSPHVVLKPRIFPDGDMWCVLLGEDLQIGVCGFGETPVKACLAFDQAWHHSKTPDAALAAPIGTGNGEASGDAWFDSHNAGPSPIPDSWKHCPSTHCERAQECRLPSDCTVRKGSRS